MSNGTDVRANHLLAVLSQAEFERWQPLLEPVDLLLSMVLYESGRP